MITTVNILPGEMEFNDTVWTVAPSSIAAYGKERIIVDHLNVSRYGQFVRIDGAVSSYADDRLKIDLSNVNLDYILSHSASTRLVSVVMLPVHLQHLHFCHRSHISQLRVLT